MINSKLLATFRALTKKERDRLALFLQSPYFQKEGIGEDEIRLFTYLHELPSIEDAEELAKAKVFKVLYPDSPFVKGKLEKKKHNYTGNRI